MCVYVERAEKVVNESSTLTKNFYLTKILLEDLITRRNLYLVSLNAYLCENIPLVSAIGQSPPLLQAQFTLIIMLNHGEP